MQFHTGRLIDHIHLRARTFAVTKRFYERVLGTLGISFTASGQGWFQADELFVDAADAHTIASHIHLAFQAQSPEAVDAFYREAIAAGGTDNGRPGARHYHPGYYACFVLDPDGNNIEAVYHGPNTRSAASVTITPQA